MADNYLITGYWGEPHVTAENDRGINAAMFGTGRFVLPVGEQFKAEYIGNNTIRMYDGKLIDNGAAAGIPAGEYVDLLIASASQGMKRNDLIVFQYSQDASTLIESGIFTVIQGTETSGTASDPVLTQEDLLSGEAVFDQMALWRVSVSSTTISSPVKVFVSLKENMTSHTGNKNNPHGVTAAQVGAQKKTPELREDQRSQLFALIEQYRTNSTNFVYDVNTTRNSYAEGAKPFNSDGRIRIGCDTLCLLAWAGIDPASFVGKNNTTYTGELVKAFDWGYQFKFPNRKLNGVTLSSGSPPGFTKPNADSYEGSYSYNSYYSPDSTREDKQVFRGFMSGSDMAQELFILGCEIPISEVQVGDMVFFKAKRLNDGEGDEAEAGAFRNISHLGLIYDVSHISDGMIGFIECTDVYDASKPIQRTRPWEDLKTYYSRAINLESRICMVARHPAAFGITNPVPNKFESI